MQNKKPTLILLEGVDKVGKSTIYQALRRETNYGPLVIDRYLASNFAYDIFWNREHYIKNYSQAEISLKRTYNVVMVYLTCEQELLKARMVKGNENMESPSISNNLIIDGYFHLYFVLSSFNKIIIDTTNFGAVEVSRLIKSFVESGDNTDVSKVSRKWYSELRKHKPYENVCNIIRIFNGEKT